MSSKIAVNIFFSRENIVGMLVLNLPIMSTHSNVDFQTVEQMFSFFLICNLTNKLQWYELHQFLQTYRQWYFIFGNRIIHGELFETQIKILKWRPIIERVYDKYYRGELHLPT